MLLDAKGQVTPASTQSHIIYRFYVKNPAQSLCIKIAYFPKRLEDHALSKAMIFESIQKYTASEHQEYDEKNWEKYAPLQNLITVSVDDPERHRGAGHRHDPDQLLTIGVNEASPGFICGPMPTGLWEVTLSLHAIVTDPCKFELQVWEKEDGSECDG